jgi:hypothetical protein
MAEQADDGWTPEALAAEAERRAAYEATGMCLDSGYTIGHCWITICDCAFAPPTRCHPCRIEVWDLPDHIRRHHPEN